MPLPSISKHDAAQCTSHAKSTGARCRNLAAYGCKTCRLHGARKNVVSGSDHHWFKHGYRQKSGCVFRKEVRQRLAWLEELGFLSGALRGKRTPGRKPK